MSNILYTMSLEAYDTQKNNLKGLSDDRPFPGRMDTRLKSKDEIALDGKMKEYRDKEIRRAKGLDAQKKVLEADAYLPAEPFYNVKERIEKSYIYKVFQKMPKGGLLHVHSAAALSADGLIELLRSWSETENLLKIGIVTSEIKDENNKVIMEAGTLNYIVRLKRRAKGRYMEIGEYLAAEENRRTLKNYLTINRETENKDVWLEFNHIFSRTSGLFEYGPFYRKYHEAFFRECLNDRIYYVEIRCGFEEVKGSEEIQDAPMIHERIPEYTTDRHLHYHDMMMEVDPVNPDAKFLDALTEAVQTVNVGRDMSEQIKLKVILNARRSLDAKEGRDKEQLAKKIDAAIVLKRKDKYANLIIGFDFVSEEDRGQTTDSYAKDIIYGNMGTGYTFQPFPANHLGWEEQPRIQNIHFFLHDGESNWNDDANVLDAAIISKHRIGHGFNMNKFMEMTDKILKNKANETIKDRVIEPVLEICPISNQLLRYIPDLRNHPAYELMKKGIGCVICSDDPQILDNPGLSYDFYEAYMGMQLSLADIKAMVKTAYCYQKFSYYGNGNLDGAYDSIEDDFNQAWNGFVNEANKLLF